MGKQLTYKDIIAKHDELKKRKEKKTMEVYCKALGDNPLIAESLNDDELQKCLERMATDGKEGLELFIFLSIPELQHNELLDAFKCNRNGELLVDRIFTTAEILQIGKGLQQLNGLSAMNEDGIKLHFIEKDLKN